MMMSLSIARRRIVVMKHRPNSLHCCPVQASVRASSLFHSRLASGNSANSARSPVAVFFSQAAQYWPVRQVVKLLPTQIIVASLHVTNRKPGPKCPLQERNIFVEQLLLQVLGASRDDHALAGADRGHEIGQRFSGSRASFHDQVTFLFQGLFDCLRHL
jgi:hypothetical protein